MAQTAEYFRQYRARKAKAGLCRDCLQPVKNPGGVYCSAHLKYKQDWNALHNGAESTARSRASFEKWSKAGLCHRCGRERAPRRLFCSECLDDKRQSRAEWRLRQGMLTRAEVYTTACQKAADGYLAVFPRIAKDAEAAAWVKSHPEVFKDRTEQILFRSLPLEELKH